MIGSIFVGQSNLRQRYLLVAGIGLLLTIVGFVAMPWVAMLCLPLTVGGIVGALQRPPVFQIELRPEGLHFQPGDRLIPYASIVAVTGLRKAKDQGGMKPFPIDVCGEKTGLRIPAHPEIPARELEEFLISRASPFINTPADKDVAEFYDQECAKYGPDRVALHHGRTGMVTTFVTRHYRWFAFGWIVGAFIALGLSFNLYPRVNSAAGTAGVMLGTGIVLFLVSFLSDSHFGLKRQQAHQTDSLVVSPSGLALCQGKLKGKLRWDEVRNIAIKGAAANVTTGSMSTGSIGQQSLHLQIPGASIILAEVYDRSLTRIKQSIEQHCHSRSRA